MSDFKYLETLAQFSDQVEIDSEVHYLMEDPTKKRAAEMYEKCIEGWFSEHKDAFDDDSRVRKMRKHYLI